LRNNFFRMNKSLWRSLQPHVIAIAIFFVISCIYCVPALKGMVLNQYDQVNYQGMVHQSLEFKEKHGHAPLWTNSMFSGMPAFQVYTESHYNISIAYLHALFTLFLPVPAGLFFLACLGCYILCMVLGTRSWVGILGALAYAFASYNAVITSVGHLTKFSSMGYTPAVLAGLILLTQRKYVAGFLSTLVFGTVLTFQGHFQILYYTLLIGLLMGIAYTIVAIRQKSVKHLLISASLAGVALVMGILSYAVVLLPTQDYGKETQRGGRSELTLGKSKEDFGKKSDGLDRDYAFIYSFGVTETFSLVAPRIFGGSDPEAINGQYRSELGDHSRTAAVLAEQTGMQEDQANQIAQSPQFSPYWGPQSGTSGAFYAGAIIIFLFILGLVVYRGWHLGWLIAATVLGMVLAWGKNFPAVNNFLFDHLWGYNKLRAPSMAMVIPQLTIPVIAVLGLEEMLAKGADRQWAWKKFKLAAIITAALFVILGYMYFSFEYTGTRTNMKKDLAEGMLQQLSQGQKPTPEMEQRANEFGRSVSKALQDDRKALFGGDLLRSLLFIALGVGVVALFLLQKIKAQVAVIALTALSFIDLIGVDLRYLNNDNYLPKEEILEFVMTDADRQIKQDTGYYRVANVASGNLLTDSRTSYYHNNVGGYSAARLGLYEDLLNYQLSRNNLAVFNMLNTKYFIVTNPATQQPAVQRNPDALGAAWLVKAIKYVNNADEEMTALNSFHPADTVIIDKREQPKVTVTLQPDSTASISLVQNLNDVITYRFKASSNQFAVFSEVYYPRGWKAFIDDKEAPIVKVNYALRGLAVPAGQHTIVFKFEPRSFALGDLISLIVGILSILALLGGSWYLWKTWKKEQQAVKATS